MSVYIKEDSIGRTCSSQVENHNLMLNFRWGTLTMSTHVTIRRYARNMLE